jgi:hypothetical protein
MIHGAALVGALAVLVLAAVVLFYFLMLPQYRAQLDA